MLIEEPTLRPGLYRLPDDPVASMILIPGFKAANKVRGAFGWFTAGWIGRLAPGLAEYLNRESASPIEFTVSPALFPDERLAVERGASMTADEAAQIVAEVFVGGRAEASALGRHALDCLAWMIATGRLRLRIALPEPQSNYHPKIWLFEDDVHRVLARGSGNATGRGVSDGVEHIDVDVSWMVQSRQRVSDGVAMLDDWAEGRSLGISEVVELPEAIAREIIQTAPAQPPQPQEYAVAARHDGAKRGVIESSRTLYRERRLRIPVDLEWTRGTYAHQGEAVMEWEGGDIPEHGVISMATGAGKTLTALVCAARCQDRLGGRPFLVVVSAPSIPLVMQWCTEIRKFGVTAVAPSLEANVASGLTHLFRGLAGGGTHVAVVTNNLLCTPSFQSTVAEKIANRGEPVPTMLIADEAHTLGAESFIQHKPEFFEKRLALSATPERQYDPDGTEEVFSFFGPPVYEFGLDRAIGFCLVRYHYYVHACTLDGDELEEFERLSRRIGAAMGARGEEEDPGLQRLLIARRKITESGRSKIGLLRAVLELRNPRSIEHALIYATAKDPGQFEAIAALLTELQIRWAPVTQETTRAPKTLTRTLESFAKGACQVLLAKKVLDEGIDIPTIREAFIVASSTIEREWIQRRGRVLRVHPEKPWAMIHDFLALPPVEVVRRADTASLKTLIRNELSRGYTFGAHADNAGGCRGVRADLDRIREAYWPENRVRGQVLRAGGEQQISSGTPRGRPW